MKLSTLLFFTLWPIFQTLTALETKTIIFLLGTDTFGSPYWNNVFVRKLSSQGHKVIVVASALHDDQKQPNVDFFHLEHVSKMVTARSVRSVDNLQMFSSFSQAQYWYLMQNDICSGLLKSKGLDQMLHLAKPIGGKVDLIIYDASQGPTCLLAFAQLFKKAPIVGVSVVPASLDVLTMAGSSYLPLSTLPFFTTGFGGTMSFWQRMTNTISYTGAMISRWIAWSQQYKRLAGDQRLQDMGFNFSWDAELDRVKLVLVNSHPSMDHAQLLPPNVIEVGGLQFNESAQPLSPVQQKFINGSRKGIFLITQGRTNDAEILGEERQQMILEAVSMLPDYGFIWQIQRGILSVKAPKNVFVTQAVVENVILAHPKTKGFITDGAHLSLQAAVYYGVPVIVIPLKIHHTTNAARAVTLGYGLQLDLNTFDASQLKHAISDITQYGRYSREAKRRQNMFRTRPQQPMDLAMWWIDHVLTAQPNQFDYLSSPKASKLNYIEQLNWDVQLLLLVMLFPVILYAADIVGILNLLQRHLLSLTYIIRFLAQRSVYVIRNIIPWTISCCKQSWQYIITFRRRRNLPRRRRIPLRPRPRPN